MYKLLRDTHLLLGLFLCSFVLMFGVSTVQMAHQWFLNESTDTELTVPVDPARASSPRELALHLMETQGFRGGLHDVNSTEEEFSFLIGRMGTVHEVKYQRASRHADVNKRVWPLIGIMVWMHTSFGLDNPYAPQVFWGWLMLLTSVGLLVLGATGIYLWFKIPGERRIGTVLLVGNLAFGLILTALLYLG